MATETLGVGFIGLGTMGAPMAWRVHGGGHLRAVYNRSPEPTTPFAKANIEVASTPAELMAQVGTVIVMVADDTALEAVFYGEDGVLAALAMDNLVINMSTVSRTANETLAAEVRDIGAGFVEAPVSGTRKPAEDGALTILAGGSAKDVEAARPLFELMGKATVDCGEVGHATDAKHAVNLLLGSMMQGFSEALIFGAKRGVSTDTVIEAITTGATDSPLYNLKGKAIRDGDFEKQFPIKLLLKDLDLVLQAGRDSGVYLPLTAATRECVNAANAKGHGEEDMAALIKLLEYVASTQVY